jgi:hypothetical protein
MINKHPTPRPWQAQGTRVLTTMESHRAEWQILDCAGGDDGIMPGTEAEDNAELIVRAVNNHDALAAALVEGEVARVALVEALRSIAALPVSPRADPAGPAARAIELARDALAKVETP